MRARTEIAFVLSLLASLVTVRCGSDQPAKPVVDVSPTPTPAPTPTPTPSQPTACLLTHPTVDCATRKVVAQELAQPLQDSLNYAMATPGAMYPDGKIYDMDVFRSKTIESLTVKGLCGAWDYGNQTGDEIYLRSADGCVIEQYDIISGTGGVRIPNKKSNVWSAGWGTPVPPPRPTYGRAGDPECSLPGDRYTYCFTIKGSPGRFGADMYAVMNEVLAENPGLIDKSDFMPGQGGSVPGALRLGAWRLLNKKGYFNAIQAKLHQAGYCGFVDGDILKVKNVALGNVLHEEMDVLQNPASGGDYTGFVIKDRCHNAGF